MTQGSRWREAWRGFLALPLIWNVLLGRAPQRARLPIDFLPADIGVLRRRRPTLLLVGDAITQQRCLRLLLQTELARGPVTWLGADEAALRALGPEFEAQARRGRLQPLAWTPAAAAHLHQRGDAHLLQELRSFGLRERELLVVDLGTPWLGTLPADANPSAAVQQAAAALMLWAERRPLAPVLALAPTHHGLHALLPLFERSSLPAVAQLQRHGEQTHLEVLRWPEGRAGTVQDLGFGLMDRSDGGWQADGAAITLQTHELTKASDAMAVLTLSAAAPAGGSLPPAWQCLPDLPALVAACRYAVAATVLLPCARRDELPALVAAVRSLRQAHPHALKIVVREVGVSLRYNQELALLRAGANAVLYRDADFARVQQTLLELRHQTYSRRGAGGAQDAATMLSDVAPDPVRGYLPLAAFCDAAERMLDRTEPLGLSHCIVQLPLAPEVSHLDALAACHIGRDGDLVSTDAQALWLFLFACRAPDVETTLKRLFSLPPAALFNQMRVRPEPEAMRRALARLRREAVDAVTDYSDALKAVRPPRLEVGESGFVMLQPEGLDTLPAPLDELPAPVGPAPAPERIQLRLRP